MTHDPACLLIDKDHDGPHVVPPDHPALRGHGIFRCSHCGYALHDASFEDVNDHWTEHLDAAHRATALLQENWPRTIPAPMDRP